jgi:ABC-type Na+ efflux pump permease subunit
VDAPVRYGRARRGQVLPWLAVSLAVLGAVALGGCLYLGLATVRLSSAEPFATALDWLAASGVAAGAALVALVLAVCSLVVSRPRYVAVLATGLALALPPVAVYLAVSAGLAVATRNVAADGTELVALVSGALDQLGVEAGPVRGVLEWFGTWAAEWALGSE